MHAKNYNLQKKFGLIFRCLVTYQLTLMLTSLTALETPTLRG